ncbi:MAG: putative bifunctional diguanylate cyclase/phosphodiesterase [Congregibacter sp.]
MQVADSHRSALVAFLLLLIAAGLLGVSANSPILQRFDLLLYDLLLPLQSPEMSDEITVVAIDDRSIEALGRWPWDRRLHAQLIDQLAAMNVRVIGMDILFVERQDDNPQADRDLAAAVATATVVLPIAPALHAPGLQIDELLPLPELATAAAAMGHVDLELDLDGLCRSTFLYGGVADAYWPGLPLAMLATGSRTRLSPPLRGTGSELASGWSRADQRLIPFTKPSTKPRILSFTDVLNGRVSRDALAGKYVLVGVTATGLGDAISTPGAPSHERMPGVLVNAQILNGLLVKGMIKPLATSEKTRLSLILVLAISLLIFLSPLRLNLLLGVLGFSIILSITVLLLVFRQIWYPAAGSLTAVICVFLGWTGWQYQREQQLRSKLLGRLDALARYNAATGLPTHGMLEERLRRLAQNSEDGDITALIVMHVNWPGSATIVLDRPISDGVLQTIRDRLHDIGKVDDFVAHLSGDDFAVLTGGYATIEDAREGAATFLTLMQQPLKFEEEPLLLVPQLGVSFWPTDTRDPQQLLSNAYTAMFTARMDDSDPLNLYSATVGAELYLRSRLEQAIAFALERDEFQLYYQPQVCANTGRIMGVEALLRWNNEELGWITPGEFVPVAEHVGLIHAIGAWAIEESCRQLKAWNQAGFDGLRLAINISPRQFLGERLKNDIEKVILDTELDPSCVEIEITESSLMRDVESAIRVMHTMKDFGLELAIDDFGTGYSSLSSLRDFPVDRLKIDITFVREIGKRKDAEEITGTIIAIARQLDLKIIAEGVETPEQAAFLCEHGCDELQGYLFARPMPAEEISDLLAKSALGVIWY